MDFHRKTFNYELSNPSKITKINGAAQFSSTIKKIFNRIGIAETRFVTYIIKYNFTLNLLYFIMTLGDCKI